MELTPTRLAKLVESSFGKFDPHRRSRTRFISQYVGRFYRSGVRGDDDMAKASPLNMMYSAVTTMVPNLVFSNPRVQIDTSVLMYRDYADMLARAVGVAAKRMNLRNELRMVVLDAIFLAGFMKTGLAVGDKIVQFEGMDINVGEPFAERVDPDDMILDPMARSWDEQAFMGNRFRADVDHLIEQGYAEADILEGLARTAAEEHDKNRAANITNNSAAYSEEPRRYVDLCEIYLPRERRVVTIPYKYGGDYAGDFIRSIDYDGPDTGPYHMLGFAQVPDNILPVAPAGIWYDLHLLGNKIARKLARQAERNKRVLAYEDDADEDVEAIAESSDGETVRVNDLNKIKEVEFGGASENSYTWMEWVKRAFSEQAGSLELLSGTGSGAPTATQAELQQANTSVRLGDMQGAVYDFTGRVLADISFYIHTDPLIELPLIRRVDGVEKQELYTPEMRKGEWIDYNLSVEPYSMARTDPNQSLRRKMEFATNVIPAAANAAAMLGPGFNVSAFLSRMAREVGIEDADEWLNLPETQRWMQIKLAASLQTGDPGKAAATDPLAASPTDSLMNAAMFNPSQPNPSATGPTGGISVATERAQAQQEAAGDLQSARSLALTRGI